MCLYIYMYVCMYVCMYVYIYVYMKLKEHRISHLRDKSLH